MMSPYLLADIVFSAITLHSSPAEYYSKQENESRSVEQQYVFASVSKCEDEDIGGNSLFKLQVYKFILNKQ